MLHSFPPIVAEDPKVLILGSMPSVTSLQQTEYYGFKHNRFWKIIGQHFDCSFKNYREKELCIIQNQLALWDVIATCKREGSLDSMIKDEVCNDILSFLKQYPSIKTVLCNGKKSFQLFQKHFGTIDINCICLPSTSNANRSISEIELFQIWNDALTQSLSET